jgi:glycyl-tRNA synthetase beta chain
MGDRRDLLVEIGTEELPPSALLRLSEAFAEGFSALLDQHGLGFLELEPFATPRRLALLVRGLASAQPDREVMRRGPSVTAAFDERGDPTKAALGFAGSCGVAVGDLQRQATDKGEWLVFRQTQAGRSTASLIPPMVEEALAGLPIPKRMRWGDREDEFVRPVHWVVLLFGDEVVSGRLFGISAGRETRGHRFHHPAPLRLATPGDYPGLLRGEGRVEPSIARRRDSIRTQVEALAEEAGGRAVVDGELLDEVAALCEWPTAIVGAFDEGFLEVPAEVLIETMQKHQKYFPVRDAQGRLLPKFIAVSNIESLEPEQVRAGNERVIRPRFADAAFFWEQDRKVPLEAFASALQAVVFQERLGSVADKSARVAQMARHLAGLVGFDEELAARAAYLAKCDLMTKMIFEFGSLQGVMGRYYAQRSGEHPQVCAAMEEQYLPRHAGDRLPASECGRILSVADKLDTLVGIFAIGQRPTGVKDPYALRRAAIGLLRILIETPLALDLKDLLDFAAQELRHKLDARQAANEVFDYAMERLQGYYQDKGIGADVVDAVLATGVTDPSDAHQRILAVKAFIERPEARSLTAANKRIRNILRKAGGEQSGSWDASLLREPAEEVLASRIDALGAEVRTMVSLRDYTGALQLLAGLRPEVDGFFEQVMVMTEDAALRDNRLALLAGLEGLFMEIADFSCIQQAAS